MDTSLHTRGEKKTEKPIKSRKLKKNNKKIKLIRIFKILTSSVL
jgi:hypothetical protein